jgi:hypothetical protein
MSSEPTLLPCPFCNGAMQLRYALWPSEGDRDAVIHAAPTSCPIEGAFSIDTFDNGVSVSEAWNTQPALTQRDEHIRVLTEALKPFADAISRYDAEWNEKTGDQPLEPDDEKVAYLGWLGDYFDLVTLGDFRRARTALATSPAEADGAVNNGA